MSTKRHPVEYHYFSFEPQEVIRELGGEALKESLRTMLLIRNFERRAESAYQHGLIGGFFHSYTGQEAIQTAAVCSFGRDNWWVTSYRCHALALLLGATPNEIMAELFGRSNGNAKGRGGSMHLYTEKLLGGFAIVSGQLPVAAGAAFALKYLNQKDKAAICFLGDGAVAQGSFHESLNMASLWDLPVVYVIENNQWGMGTHFQRAISVDRLAEDKASGYNMKAYTLQGQDFLACYAAFKHIRNEVTATSRPVLVEAVTERFRGHSISDPGLYRSKGELKTVTGSDPLFILKNYLVDAHIIDDDEYKAMDKETRDISVKAYTYAEESPWPSIATLEEDVFAPNATNLPQKE